MWKPGRRHRSYFVKILFRSGNVDYNCWLLPETMKSNLDVIDWIKHIWKNEKVYNKLYLRPMEKFFIMAWSIWIHRNNVIFIKHVLNLIILLTYWLIYLSIWDITMLFLVYVTTTVVQVFMHMLRGGVERTIATWWLGKN